VSYPVEDHTLKTWIVAKKHFYELASVYALTEEGQHIHLLQPNGSHLSVNTKFDVGQIWDLTFRPAPRLIPPHVEDVIVTQQKFLDQETQLHSLLLQRASVKKGGPDQLFQGCLKTVIGDNKPFIDQNTRFPHISMDYWLPDAPLIKWPDEEGRIYYRYYVSGKEAIIQYTGLAKPTFKIPEQTLVHVSLGTWWKPSNLLAVRETSKVPERCYLQISGWYM